MAEFSQEHLDDLRVAVSDLKLPEKGLYSHLIPELSQPAFESCPLIGVRADGSNFGGVVGAPHAAHARHVSIARRNSRRAARHGSLARSGPTPQFHESALDGRPSMR